MKENGTRYAEALATARAAADAAVAATRPTPMIVEQHTNMADDSSPVARAWFVEGGVCGFGWVEVRPTNSRFGRWLRANGHGHHSKYDHCVWISMKYGQSLARNEAAAVAFAKALQAALADEPGTALRISPRSRID